MKVGTKLKSLVHVYCMAVIDIFALVVTILNTDQNNNY